MGKNEKRRLEELASKIPEFMLQEYWQLRNEIRDRMNRKQAIIVGTVTAVAATAAVTVSPLASNQPSFLLVSAIWLIPHLILHPAIMLMRSEILSIVRLARYIRLHVEMPFLEAMQMHPFTEDWRKPHGWETCLLLARIGNDLCNAPSAQGKVGDRDPPFLRAGRPEQLQKFKDSVLKDPDQRRALEVTAQSFRDLKKSVSWVFRGLSIIACTASILFAGLTVYMEQWAHIAASPTPNALLPKEMVWAFVIVVTALSVAALWSMFFLVRRYKQADSLSSYWDIHSLDAAGLSALLQIFKD